jgi:hypothetical protein
MVSREPSPAGRQPDHGTGRREPQRHVGGLEGVGDGGADLGLEGAEVDLVAEPGGEALEVRARR